MFSTSNRTVIVRGKIYGYTNITKTNRFTGNERFNRFTTDQSSNRFTAYTSMDRFTVTNITGAERLVNRRKNDRLITTHNTHRFSNNSSTNRFTRIQRHFIKLFRTLKNDKPVTIYHRNLQTLVYEAFKIKNKMAPKILTDILSHKEYNYNVKNSTGLQGRTIGTVPYGSEIISSLGPKIWDILTSLLHY